MSFQRLAVKEPPLSEVTTVGTPKKATQEFKKAVAAAWDEASVIGAACTNLVVLSTAVSRYL